jgi:1-acyl-sn-glycerol-3-phosphate acyltransferase
MGADGLLPLSVTTSTESSQRNGARPYPRTLPQWILNLIRPIVRVLSRIFWRISWHHTEHIPLSGSGLIIAANHQTYIDPFWVCSAVKRPVRFLAWDAAFNWPIVGLCLRGFGAWPLQLEGVDPGPIRRSLQWINEGGAVMIFPEGGRGNADGSTKKFKAGAVRMALEAGVPILPVTIRGGEGVWPSSRRLPRFRRQVEIIFHAPINVAPCESEDTRQCARRETARLSEIVQSDL